MTTSSETFFSPFDLAESFFDRFEESKRDLAKTLFLDVLKRRNVSSAEVSKDPDAASKLLYSILALKEFFQLNWVGPSQAFSHPLLVEILASDQSTESLVIDGEYPYRLTKSPGLLVFALRSLAELHELETADGEVLLWYARALFLHVRLLDSPSPSLRVKLVLLAKRVKSVSTALQALEWANFMQECEEEKMAQEFIDQASSLVDFSYSFTGRAGRRTIHQTFDIYQLTVQVNDHSQQATQVNHSEAGCCSAHPRNVALNDDHLRENVSYTDGVESTFTTYNNLAILLATARQLWRFHARDAQTTEKLSALLEKILESPNSWQIFSAALFWRSKIESDRSRTVERACLQFKALAEQVDLVEPDQSSSGRLNWTFSVWFPAAWECDREQGLLFAGLGAYKTALEIFEKREMFEESVQCLLSLGQIEDAEGMLLKQLKRFPKDAKLICTFGDVKRKRWEIKLAQDDGPETASAFKTAEETYQRAWRVSGNRLAKAQRNLASLYYVIGNYEQAIQAITLAVNINPLFESSWFLLGLSALQLEDYEAALRAFTRIISLNSDSPEGWKHLAHCQVKLGKLADAHRALLQLTRIQFDQSDGWLSLFSIALAVGEPSDAIKALRRHVEILTSISSSFTTKESGKIIEMTSLLIDLIIRVCLQAGRAENDQMYREMTFPVKRQFEQFLLDFLGQTGVASIAEFWLQVARYVRADHWPQYAIQVREALLKAYRCLQSRPYDKDPNTFKIVTQIIAGLKETSAVLQAPDDLQTMINTVKRRCQEAFEETEAYKLL